MGDKTSISWTDHTFSPWIGCAKVSAGCARCYAEAMDRRWGRGRWGLGANRDRTSAAYWSRPAKWNAKAQAEGRRHRVFCGSMCDVFDAQVPDVWRVELFDVIRRTPWLDWQLLTKRPENIGRLVTAAIDAFPRAPDAAMVTVDELLQPWVEGHAPANVWLGVSVENQEAATKRIPTLLQVPARVRFLSMEPLLEPVDLCRLELIKPQPPHGPGVYLNALTGHVAGPDDVGPRVDWVIVGGESGPGARPFDLAWGRRVLEQCVGAGVACFIKQLGARPVMWRWVDERDDHELCILEPEDPKGGDWDEWPKDLCVRQFPAAEAVHVRVESDSL